MKTNDLTPLVSAWVGQGNFGDELLSYGLRLAMRSDLAPQGVDYFRVGPHPVYRGEVDCHIGVHSRIARSRFGKVIDAIRPRLGGYNALVFGGGSVLHSTNSISWKRNLVRSFRERGGSKGAPVGGVGLSVGPFKDLAAERAAAEFLKALDFLVVRDRASMAFAAAHMRQDDISLGRDLAFSVRDHRPALFRRPSGDMVGLSFIRNSRDSLPEQHQKLCAMIGIVDRLTGMGRPVRLIAMHYGAGYRDHVLHDQIWAGARRKEMIERHVYADDVAATLAVIAECSHFASMRLHGCIAAHLCGRPFLSLSSHPKAAEFSSQVPKAQAGVADLLSDPQVLGDAIDNLLASAAPEQETELSKEADHLNANEFLRRRLHLV